MSYFTIEFLLIIFSSFFLQLVFLQPRMNNLASSFSMISAAHPGVSADLFVFSLICCFNIFISQIPSPIFLSSSKSPFTSSQLNNCCDNLICITFVPCASLCNFSSNLHCSHPQSSSAPSFLHYWCRYSP